MKKVSLFFWILFFHFFSAGGSEADFPEKFSLKTGELHLAGTVQPGRYFESLGQKSAVLGTEDGNTEIWIYPYKVLHNFQLYFLIEEDNKIVDGREVVNRIDVYPHQTTLRYVHSSFTVKETFFSPLRESGVVILLSVESIKPLSIIASFTPDLKPMWPAGLGGQYSYWDSGKKYFVISEGTGKNVALVGSPGGERFSSGPAHALPEGDMKMKIHVDPKVSKQVFIPIFISASFDGRRRAENIYSRLGRDFEELYSGTFNHYESLVKEHLSVQTPDRSLNQAFQWAKVAVDKAFVCNPQLGCGLVAGYGLSGRSERPGFAWFFGGDTFFNSWAINSYGYFDVTRQGLAFIRKNQREDGKIMHELSQGAAFIPWFEKYPYGFYHAETSPYYIISLNDYLKWSGDLEFIKESWPSIKKAYKYVLSSDTDGDGLMENTVAGLAALELGAFLEKTKSDIYLAALSVEAHRVLSELANLMGEKKLSRGAEKTYTKALETLRDKFWVEAEKKYAHALTVEDKPLAETTVWPFMPLFFRQFPQKRANYILDLFASSEMSTDWGVRSLSPKSSYYDPLNYNYGTVWPFLTGYACLSEYNYGRSLAGYSHLMSLAFNTFIDALGFCPELFSGEFFKPIEASVPHQIFSSSPVITCLVRGLLGLGGNALKSEIKFRPSLPGNWDRVKVRNFRIGKDIFNFNLLQSEKKLICQIDSEVFVPYRIFFCPSLGYGAQVKAVKVNGKEKDFLIEQNSGEVRAVLDCEIKGNTRIEILTEKSIFIHLPPSSPQIGDKTTGLKIIRAQYKNNQLGILVEGLGGKEYSLSLLTTRPVHSVVEATMEEAEKLEKKIKIRFKRNEEGYMRKEVIIQFGK
ncbi:MAG: GH116 family glycosyl hydrolase [Candidatus Aminicenantaceae bacterium]